MSDGVTLEKILRVMRELRRAEPWPPMPSPLLGPPIGDYMGMKVFEAPTHVQKIELWNITLKDGTPITTPEFRAEYNAWLAERFGYREPLPRYQALYLAGMGIVMRRDDLAMLRASLA
jgi:hypothetical protein